MRSWALRDGDLFFEKGQMQWVEGAEELAQAVQVRLGTRLGEYFFAPDMGIDHELVTGKHVTEDSVREALTDCIAEEERVNSLEVESMEFDEQTRQLNVELFIAGQDGEEVSVTYANEGWT
ncbi:contractile injection system sheath initiator [Paenibacillus sp. 481]|uniref:contractile injection system sheath initiator n=1 Tax=Paenibacillus sp. 481 TaxID=2835869 RepID=UPI001E49675B|nr:hypothetical protein [Paenibacillus sp. 481]UHA71941.1 hypothetical protein KIK04_14505 [Paenibacillus sp. 481]